MASEYLKGVTLWSGFFIREFLLTVFLVQLCAGQALAASAITSDGSIGTRVTQGGTFFDITGGSRRGANLFHSFGLFSVGEGDTANFLNESGLATSNIIGRVTGRQTSNIFGTIKTTNFGKAGLFLINPAGWLFGPTASLNVGGSFHVSTADYLKFADGAKFHADLSKQSALTSAPVSAFGFLSQSPAGIAVQGSFLQVPEGETLSLVGGNLSIGDPVFGAFLDAQAGKIQLASVASPGEVPTNVQDMNAADFQRLGEIDLTSSFLSASGNGGGTVAIRGGRFIVDSTTIFVNNFGEIEGSGLGVDINIAGDATISNSSITTDSFDTGRAKDLQIRADTLQVDNSVIRSASFSSGNGGNISLSAENLALTNATQIGSSTFSSGNAGNVLIEAGNLSLTNGAQIDTSTTFASGHAGNILVETGNLIVDRATINSDTFGPGNGGSITILASDTITVGGFPTGIFARAAATGDAGDIVLEAKNVRVIDGGQISSETFNSGNGGGLKVVATDTISLDGLFSSINAAAQSGSTGSAGDIIVEAKNVIVRDDAYISGSTFGPGKGGTVRVTAQETVNLNGPGIFQTGIFTDSHSDGKGGDIRLKAPRVTVDASLVRTGSVGKGQAGSISVEADSLLVQNGSLFSSAAFGKDFGAGSGGSISLNASESVSFSGASSISSGSEGPGNAGTVNIQSPLVRLSGEGIIEANANGAGNGGDIRIAASQLAILDGFSLTTRTTGTGMAGGGGNIDLNVTDLVIISGGSGNRPSSMNTGTLGDGNAGNIFITSSADPLKHAPFVLLDGGIIGANSADSEHLNNQGNSGDISFNVANLTLQNGGRIFAGTTGKTTAGVGGRVTIEASQGVFIGASSAISNGVLGSGAAKPITIRAPILVVSGPSGLIESISTGSGAGGIIDLEVGSLQLRDGGAIVSGSTREGSGGTINVKANNLLISGNGVLLTDSSGAGPGAGPAGNINILAKDIKLMQGAQISAESEGAGNTGNINIIARNTFRSVGSSITTEAETSDGGNIKLSVGSLVELVDSQITATVKSGFGGGGNISIDPTFVVLSNSQIIANAFGGPGGNIDIVADVFLKSPDSIVSASSALGLPGTVDIQAAITDLSGSLAPLPEAVLQATSLLQQSCAARFGDGKVSSLVAGGREGLPFEPGTLMRSPLYRIEAHTPPTTSQKSIEPYFPNFPSMLALVNPLLPSTLGCK